MSIRALEKQQHPFLRVFTRKVCLLALYSLFVITFTAGLVLILVNMSSSDWSRIAQDVPAVALEDARAMGVELPVAKVSYEYDGEPRVAAATVESTVLKGDTFTVKVDRDTAKPTTERPDYLLQISLIIIVGMFILFCGFVWIAD